MLDATLTEPARVGAAGLLTSMMRTAAAVKSDTNAYLPESASPKVPAML